MLKTSSKEEFKKLKYEDLETKTTFRKWVASNMQSFYSNREIPNSDLSLFLDKIIKPKVDQDRTIDRASWLSRIRNIQETINAVEEYDASRQKK